MEKNPNTAFIRSSNLLLGATAFAILSYIYMRTSIRGEFLFDGQGLVVGRDFLNFWHYGIAAWLDDPVRYYDLTFYNDKLKSLFDGYDYPSQQWSYPPHYLLLAAPFGLVGYNIALPIYILFSLLLYWLVIVRPFDEPAYRRALWLAPALYIFLACGQASALLAVLFVAIFSNLDRRPVVAGLLIALMTVKPQLGLLFPVFLIVTARWKVFAVAALGTIVFIGASVLIHGSDIWWTFIENGIGDQSNTLIHSAPIIQGLMPTAFVNFFIAGFGVNTTSILHGLVALGVLAVMVIICRKVQDRFYQYAIFISCTFVISPYMLVYDTLVLAWLMLMLAKRLEMGSPEKAIYKLVMLLGPIGVFMAVLGIPGSFLILIGLMWWVARDALLHSRSATQAQPAAAALVAG